MNYSNKVQKSQMGVQRGLNPHVQKEHLFHRQARLTNIRLAHHVYYQYFK
jgi:hypothetical protein